MKDKDIKGAKSPAQKLDAKKSPMKGRGEKASIPAKAASARSGVKRNAWGC